MTDTVKLTELNKRDLAAMELGYFIKYTFAGFQRIAYQGTPENRIHDKIISALERVESGKCKRLKIFCPPRLGKSIISSQYFPAWFLGRHPNKKVIVASYGSDLANDFGRKTKRICEDTSFKNIFPDFKFAKDKKEGGNRETSEEGGYYAVGVGGATTGKGADVLIIDDPVKDRTEADSPTIQQRNVDWFDSVVTTRLQSQDSAIIMIMTRWNVSDLGGYDTGDEREEVVIQGIDEDNNEIVRPGKRDVGHMKETKRKMLPKNWAALYQQDPIASSDGIFKREYFDYWKLSDFEKEDGILKKQDVDTGFFIDPAFSSSDSSDDAVIVFGGRHRISGQFYQIDGYADTSATSRTMNVFTTMYNKAVLSGRDCNFVSVEDVTLNKEQSKFIKELRAKMVEMGLNCPLIPFKPVGKKEFRIKDTLESVMSQKGIKFRTDMEDKTFLPRLETQFLDFPNGKKDDIIDCIEQMVRKSRPPKSNDRYATESIPGKASSVEHRMKTSSQKLKSAGQVARNGVYKGR